MAIKWNSPSRKGAQSMPPSKQEIGRSLCKRAQNFCSVPANSQIRIAYVCKRRVVTKSLQVGSKWGVLLRTDLYSEVGERT